jgi:hypothetical protein
MARRVHFRVGVGHTLAMTDAARSSSSKRYSWDDFLTLDDDDRRELIDGELVEVEVPNKSHEHIVSTLSFFLTAWARAGHGGYSLGSGYEIRISASRGVMPDVQFFCVGNPATGQMLGLARGRSSMAPQQMMRSSRRRPSTGSQFRWPSCGRCRVRGCQSAASD